jgi:hypothetical protein
MCVIADLLDHVTVLEKWSLQMPSLILPCGPNRNRQYAQKWVLHIKPFAKKCIFQVVHLGNDLKKLVHLCMRLDRLKNGFYGPAHRSIALFYFFY